MHYSVSEGPHEYGSTNVCVSGNSGGNMDELKMFNMYFYM